MAMMEESLFDKIADQELRHLEKALGDMDPDELEVELALDVLTLTLADGSKLVINSHRAARQIWMAAFRRAWHFSPALEDGTWRWRTGEDELRSTLGRLLGERLGRPVQI